MNNMNERISMRLAYKILRQSTWDKNILSETIAEKNKTY